MKNVRAWVIAVWLELKSFYSYQIKREVYVDASDCSSVRTEEFLFLSI